MEDLRILFDRTDFKEVWLRIAASIKVRTYNKLDDIPELNQLPSKIKEQIKYCSHGVKFNYDTFQDEGLLYNTAYVVLIDQGRENWMGMFEYNYATTTGKVLGMILGAGVLIGGIYYFCAAAPKHVESLIGYISQNFKTVQDAIIKFAGTLLTGAAVTAFIRWLTNDHSEWNLLIAACILKKIQGVRNS